MEIIVLLLLLQVKHYWADFGIQTYPQTVRKGIYRDLVGISHSVDHTWATMVVLLVFHLWHPLPAAAILGVAVVEGVLHYHIDWVKVRFGTKNMATGTFWNQFGLDQLAHQLTYLGIAVILLT